MKIVWIVLGIIVLLLGGLIGAGYWWWSSNQEVIEQQVTQAAEKAQRVAASGDSNACVDALKQQVQDCSSLTCQVGQRIFMMECLARAPLAEGFCEGVPPSDEVMRSAQWSLRQCADTGEGINACVQAMNAVPEFCATQAQP
jgi:hypothetical protein